MYVEGLGGVTLANGVLRVETLYRNARGEDVPSGELMIPAGRLHAVLKSLELLEEQLRAKTETAN